MAGSIAATQLAYAIGRRGSTTICAGLPPVTARFDYVPSALVADERVIKGSYMGSSVPKRDIPRYLGYFQTGQLPVDRLRTNEIGFQEINIAFDRLDDGIGVRQVLICSKSI
jgi:alcohol dehydrogenase